MDNQKEKDIKYKISEGNKNSILNTANYASNIKTEDDLLSQLEQLKSENRYEECITLIEQQLKKKKKNYSKEHEKFYQLAYEITDICNLKAYDLFLNSKPEEGLKFIEKSIQIFSDFQEKIKFELKIIQFYQNLYPFSLRYMLSYHLFQKTYIKLLK